MLTSRFCEFCQHDWGNGSCKAFPNGIPISIEVGEDNHRFPYEGDHGIHFEPVANTPDWLYECWPSPEETDGVKPPKRQRWRPSELPSLTSEQVAENERLELEFLKTLAD